MFNGLNQPKYGSFVRTIRLDLCSFDPSFLRVSSTNGLKKLTNGMKESRFHVWDPLVTFRSSSHTPKLIWFCDYQGEQRCKMVSHGFSTFLVT